MNQLIILFGFGTATILSFLSFYKVRHDQFFSDVPKALLATGIYVWGDGLIIGPFWMVSTVLWGLLGVSVLNMGRFYLLFLIIRSAYEVLYWINHQIVAKEYVPPLFRNITWMNPEQHGILYQLLHTCLIVLGLALLGYSFMFS